MLHQGTMDEEQVYFLPFVHRPFVLRRIHEAACSIDLDVRSQKSCFVTMPTTKSRDCRD